METFWRTKGKRIAAWLMIALIMATTIPFGSISASADDTTTGESGTVTITGQVMVPDDADSNGRAYAGAKVTVTYPNGDTTAVTKEVTTGNDGKFNIPIADWTLEANDNYEVQVIPAEADIDKYDNYSSGTRIVTDEQVNTNKIELGAITLEKMSASYSVTANAYTSDGSIPADAGTVTVEANVVTATPNEGYEITSVTALKDNADWKPDNADNEWWKNSTDETGVFKFEGLGGAALDANYAFTVTFAKKQFTIIYKISQNGKLILNSGAQDDTDKVEIKAEQESIDGNQKVPYTNDAYKIKAAVTDNKYHLTSFRVDGNETLTADINNELNTSEYTFKNGITDSHTIEVTVVIDTYKVTVNKNEGGTVKVNESEETEIEVAVDSNVTILLTPDEDKQISKLQINGQDISETVITEKEDGSLEYIISGISENKSIEVEFKDIPTEKVKGLENANVQLLDEKIKH